MNAKFLRLCRAVQCVSLAAIVAGMVLHGPIFLGVFGAGLLSLTILALTARIRCAGASGRQRKQAARPGPDYAAIVRMEREVFGEAFEHAGAPAASPLASVLGGVSMAEAQAALTEFMRKIGQPPVILPPADPDPLPAGQGCAICGGEPAVYSDAAGSWRPICGACSDGPECICNAATGGSPCTSPRCIRLDLPVRHWTGRGYVTGTLTWRQAASQGYSEQDIGLGRVPLAPAGETVPEDGDVAEIAWVSERGTVCWCSYCGGRAGVHGPEAVALYRAECDAALKRIEAGASATIYTSGSVITAAGGGAGGYSSTSSTCHPHGPGEPCSPSRLGYPGDRAQWKP